MLLSAVLAQAGPVCLKSFALRPTRALGRVLRLIGSPDTRVAMETAVGFQDWGSPKPSSVFPRSVQPPHCDVNVSLLLESAPVRKKFSCQSFVIIVRMRVSCGSKVCWRLNCALGPDVKLDDVPNDVFLYLTFPVHVRMLVAGQLETATTNCGFRQRKLQ